MIRMELTSRIYDKNSPNLDSMREQFDDALSCLLKNYIPNTSEQTVSPLELGESMQQFFNILDRIDDATENPRSEENMDDLANHGLRLLNELCHLAKTLGCEESYYKFEQLSLPLAVWSAQHHFILKDIEIIINAISHIANNTQDTRFLSRLAEMVEHIIDSISPAIKQDLDKTNPDRPWRVLNLNHGIIATRSLDPKRMEAVFSQLLYRLPDDAAGFFAEGMEQMDIIDYPPHVRSVMQSYFQLTNQPTLH
jgi:hypothetical protein